MNIAPKGIEAGAMDAQLDQITKLAVFAVGGQGGGVLNGWIVSLAERNGYDVQATSIAGVAQRTGSTIYYIEMLPKSERRPVFSLAAAEGDVDIVVAAELMEAGRAIMRGFVTPNATKMILSTHRQLATLEKVVPGDGSADADRVLNAVKEHDASAVAFDMQVIANEEGTVISAALFGALAGSGALPFEAESYRETIRASGREVGPSLAAFERARAVAAGEVSTADEASADVVAEAARGPARLLKALADLEARVAALPAPVREVALLGLRKLVEFQDVEYGAEYLTQLEAITREDTIAGGPDQAFAFSCTAAKYLANAMAYDDLIRVADAKTRGGRADRIAAEIGASAEHVTKITEFTHPGAAEVVSILPAWLGRKIAQRDRLMGLIDRRVNRGRHIRTDRIGGFLSLYLVAGMRRWRRSLLRHGQEMVHIAEWMDLSRSRLAVDYEFAVQTLCCRRLIKGYSDTHARGLSRFDRVMLGAEMVAGREDAADWTRRLIDAALADHKDERLDGALATIRSFTENVA
ncbi:MAG: indolepyruvate oxidoreductase subunit beta family protein [Pikeienuella sp.]